MAQPQKESRTEAAAIIVSPDSEALEGKQVISPNQYSDPWEERIDDENSILWTCRDEKTRRVLRLVSRRPILVKQKAAGIPREYRAARLHTWDESKSNPHTSAVVRSYVHQRSLAGVLASASPKPTGSATPSSARKLAAERAMPTWAAW